MPNNTFQDGKIVVTFDRIGEHRHVPALVLPAMPKAALKELIRAYAAPRLNDGPVEVLLSGDEGSIVVGAGSGGRFTVSRRPGYSSAP